MNRIIIIFLFSITALLVNAQCTFEKFYKYYPLGSGYNSHTISTSDGGFLTVMSCHWDPAFSSGNNDVDMAIVKNDVCGNTLWQMHYGDPNSADFASGCIELSDGSYLVAGSTEMGPAISNFRAVKFSKSGTMIWDSVYNGFHESDCIGITKRKDKNSAFIYGYENISTNASIEQMPFLLEIDENGNTLKSFGLTNRPQNSFGYFNKLFQFNDSTYDLIFNSKDTLYFIQTDTSFNIKINKPIVYTKGVLIYDDACITNNNKSIALATDYTDINSSFNCHILLFDINGNLSKNFIYPYQTFGSPVCLSPTQSNGFLIGRYLLEADSNLNFLNSNSWYNVARVWAGQIQSIIELPNRCIIASGFSNLNDTLNGEMYIIKIDSNGKYAYSGIDEAQLQNTDISIYPNPATNELHLQTISSEKLTAQLFDIIGKQVLENISFNNTTTINTQSLNHGLYFIKVMDSSGAIVKTQKVAVVK